MSSSDATRFTPKEQEKVSTLEATIRDRRLSINERQIAEAELNALRASKLPPAHNHKHRMQGAAGPQGDVERFPQKMRGGKITGVGKKDHDMYHNDEAFERYAMGGDRDQPPARQTENRALSNWESIRFNHHARGGQKMHAEDDIINEELMP